mmetsp:Transcript_61350/g.155843  ORF Transcript_61350/g.155843 Transcript_61350/m.155843 type:complete len:245 (+) Transcript_61350:679-1413(+)
MLAAIVDVLCALHKAQSDVVGVVWYRPIDNVIDLALVDNGQVNLYTGDIDVFLFTQPGIVLDPGHHVVRTTLLNLEDDSSILNKNLLARLDISGQVRVGDGDGRLVALVAVVCDQLEILASLQLLLRVVHLECAGPDLGPPSVHQNFDGATGLWPHLVCLLQVSELHALLFVVAMRHVASDGVHACIDELGKHLRAPALRTNCTNNFRVALGGVIDASNVGVDAWERNRQLLKSRRVPLKSGGR